MVNRNANRNAQPEYNRSRNAPAGNRNVNRKANRKVSAGMVKRNIPVRPYFELNRNVNFRGSAHPGWRSVCMRLKSFGCNTSEHALGYL